MLLSFVYGIPVRILQNTIDSAEFGELIAAHSLGKVPDPWQQAGVIAAAVYNANRSKNVKPFKPDDFIPKVQKKPQLTAIEQQAVLKAAVARHNARLRHG